MYEPIPYPSWRYHRTLDPVIVNDPAEDEALGDGWADTPAAFREEPTEPGNNEPAAEDQAPKKRGKRAAK